MNRTAISITLTAVFLLALVACASKQTAGDSSPAGNGNEEATQASQAAQRLPGEAEAHDASTLQSQKDTPAVNSGDTPAEVVLRDGTVMKTHPSMSTNSYLSGPGFWVDRSKVSLICFPDCKGAPRDSSLKDLIVLKDGQRKSGEITWIRERSYNSFRHVWEGNSVTLSREVDEDIPFSEIRYIKFSDHVFYSLEQALRAPTTAIRLVLRENKTGKKHLSPNLGKLINLRELDIACLEELTDLPLEIGNLRKLEKLIMDNGNGCQMSVALPASIGRLEQLRVMNLYGALGKTLPATIANLQNLEELNLGHNGIRVVPPEVASLHKLKRLVLDYDSIHQVPSFIGNLTNLKELSLNSNARGPEYPIILPQSLAALKGLKLFMGGNYLKLKAQERLRKRFPNIVFSFENEYDDSAANEEPPSKPAANTKQ